MRLQRQTIRCRICQEYYLMPNIFCPDKKTVSDQIAMDELAYNNPFAYVLLMLHGTLGEWLRHH